jgi:hypothetical protein
MLGMWFTEQRRRHPQLWLFEHGDRARKANVAEIFSFLPVLKGVASVPTFAAGEKAESR